jgi:hypothetical protein
MADAADAAASAREPRPWTQSLVDAWPFAPAWVGAMLAVGHVGMGAAYFAVFVRPGLSESWPGSPDLLVSTSVFGLVTGYAVAALAYARRGHESTLRELRPALHCSDAELAELTAAVRDFRMGHLRVYGWISAILGILITYFTTGVAQRLGQATLLWVLWQNALGGWLLTRTIAHDLRVSTVLSREARRLAEIELFDLTPLAPLAGRGLQSALLIVLALSFFSLIISAGDISPLVPVLQVATVLLAGFALVLPSLGVRRRVQQAKRDERMRLSREIRTLSARTRTEAGPERNADEAQLATLLELRQHVEAAKEWPFDLGTLGRFLVYATIGVGSWLGGAAVERLLDAVLG